MKNFYYTLLAFLFFTSVNAQIVNIPDANFKAKLLAASSTNITAKNLAGAYFKIDVNNDGEIQLSEALQVSYLDISASSISNITGIEYFTNLQHLNCYNNQLTSINVQGLTNLVTLECESNLLANLNVQGLTNLVALNCKNNLLTSLNVQGLTNLVTLPCENNQLASLNVQGLINLVTLYCNNNQLTNLNVQGLTSLQQLYCNDNQLTNLNVQGLTSLQQLYCYNNQLTNLNLQGLTSLSFFYCNNNQLTNLNVQGLTNINYLDCNNNQLTILNIKNALNESYLSFSNNPNLQYICADDFQIAQVQTKINSYGYQATCHVNTYCSFTPGGTFYTIQGNNKYDLNANGCDVLDNPIPNFKLNFSDGTNTGSFYPNSTGNYSIPVSSGTHLITPILQNPTYFTVFPTTTTVNFPATTSPATRDFCITPNGIHNDLEIAILPITAAVPGFNATYKIIYKNKGTTTQSGNINIQFPDDTTDFVSATPAVNTQNVGNLIWNYTNLLPLETRTINFTINLNSPMETPPLNAGNLIGFSGTINPIIGDEYVNDNSFALRQLVVNSFDPNDKTCLEGNTITPAKVGDFVHYMIRFENNGTAAAQNIVVKDMIDTAKYDIASLIPIDGSHSFTTKISNTNQVEFIFQNINLPFDNANNDGFVAFKIKTKSTLVLGNSFSNSANIYFDYNFPIVTNTATTTIAVLSNQDFEFGKYFSLYPNPAKDLLNIDVKNEIEVSSISIYNMLGQVVLTTTNPSKTIDVSGLKTGNYFIKINTDKGSANAKFLKE